MRGARDQLTAAEAEIIKLREELRLSRVDVEKITKERDDYAATVGERDRELGIQKEVNSKLAETQNDLHAEITHLTEAAAYVITRAEGILKKASDDIAKLESDHASVIQAHVLAVEERQQQVTPLEGEILSLIRSLRLLAALDAFGLKISLEKFSSSTCLSTCVPRLSK